MLMASKNERKFRVNGLLHMTKSWKSKLYDACWWKISIPPRFYRKGQIQLTFDKIEPGIKIYLSQGSLDSNNNLKELKPLIPGNRYAVPRKTYSLDIKDIQNINSYKR